MSVSNLTFLDYELEQEREYWRRKLEGELVVAALPLDRRRTRDAGPEMRSLPLGVDGATAERLRRLCGGSESLYLAVFVAAAKICLHKYTGLEDIIVGTTIHARHGEVAALNKVLALRDRLDGGTTVRQLLLDCKTTLAEAYAHQKFPFERLLELLEVEWPENRAPLFSLVVLLENINDPRHVAHLRHDVTLAFSVGAEGVTGRVEYRPHLFGEESIATFAKHYARVLSAAVEDPQRRVSRLELLSADERRRLLEDFNHTPRDYPRDATVGRLFDEQAARTPDAAAVVHGERALTFRELRSRANRLARHLRARGVGRATPVAVCLEHSPETIVALLGVLKAGGCYVPLDPAHPRARIAYILRDAGAALLLTQERLLGTLPEGTVPTLCLDSDWPAVGRESDEALEPLASPDDLAYVIYTSGSTGEPKGVQVSHASLVNYVWWAKDEYVGGEALDCALHSPLAFDLTVTSVYVPLLTGNTIHVYRAPGGGSAVADILADDRTGLLKLTPGHLSLIKERDNTSSRVRRLVVGGEAFETELARRVRESFGGRVEIINEYGPTEATVGCMLARFDPERDVQSFVPVGRPAANMQVYVLDEWLQPVAENVIGELYLAGDGLARGYLNRPALTAERFIPNPFAAGRRMYRTGDLARWLPRGELEYVGRRDDQIKFRGYRVELGEVRSALNRHPQIRDSVVQVVTDKNGNDVMVAYYVARQELDASALRAFLSESVIEETLPNVFVHLKKLPLTLNGKINHRALPTLEEARRGAGREWVAPRNATEETLSEIWRQVFGVERVGVHDNFFELGGHSLLANQVVARACKAFGVDLRMRSLFESPTVAELAEVVEQARARQGEGVAPGGPEVTKRITSEAAGQLLTQVEQLSDAELDALLGRMLKEGEVE